MTLSLLWDGTSADWAHLLDVLSTTDTKARTDLADLNRDPSPGYYVSAIEGTRKMLVEGPFGTHAEALVSVTRVKRAWIDVDRKAFWYAWGTARVKEAGHVQ